LLISSSKQNSFFISTHALKLPLDILWHGSYLNTTVNSMLYVKYSIYTHDTSKCLFQDAWAIHDQGAYFINGCSLNDLRNDEHDLLSRPRRASLKGLYAALLISIREQPFSLINALPLSLLILAETSISR